MAITINGTSGISGVDGSAGTPAIQGTDTNTGLTFGTDTVGVVTGGTNRATVDSSGRLLVGTSSARSNYRWAEVGSDYSPSYQVEGSGANANQSISITNNVNDNYPPILFIGKSRGTSVGSNTVLPDGERIGQIVFAGNDGTRFLPAARIEAVVEGTPGANDMPGKLLFSTTADGASSPTTRLQLHAAGYLEVQGVYDLTTGSGANVFVQSNGYIQRSTSSIKYKTDVETLEDSYADALLECRPVWYRSTCSTDDPAYGYWGFIAEEVAEIDPRLVHWKTTNPVQQEDGSVEHVPCEPEPEGVQYDRFVPHLINLIKRQKEQLKSQAATIAALDARLTALEGGAAQ